MKIGVLFIENERSIIKELIQNVIPLQEEWDVFFAETGDRALQILADNQIDFVFSSPSITCSNGANVLSEVKKIFPETIRFALVPNLEHNTIAQVSQFVHQFATPPYTTESLKQRVERASNLQKNLKNPALIDLVKNTTSLPSLPEIYIQIEQEAIKPDFSLQKIAALIAKDPNLTSKILQIVNSAFFGLQREISNISFALSYLGINVVKSLIFYIHLFSNFKVTPENRKYLEQIWKHSLVVASNSFHLAQKYLTNKYEIDGAYTAGVLHDVGKFVLLNTYNYPQNIILLTEEKMIDNYEAEMELYSCTHSDIGAYLLGLWGFPLTIIEAVSYHHNPSLLGKEQLTLATIVHIADFLYYIPRLDVEHILNLNFEKQLLLSIDYFKTLRQMKFK